MDIQFHRIDQIKAIVQEYSKLVVDNFLYGQTESSLVGKGHDFVDLREYNFSDDIRDIDWKSSLRTNALLVKRYTIEKERKAIIVCDTTFNMAGSTTIDENKTDIVLNTVGSIAYLLKNFGDRFSFLFHTSSGTHGTEFKRGMDFIELNLAILEQNASNASEDDFLSLLEYTSKQPISKHIVFLVTDIENFLCVPQATLQHISMPNEMKIVFVDDAFVFENETYDIENSTYIDFLTSRERAELLEMEVEIRVSKQQQIKDILKQYNIDYAYVKSSNEIPLALLSLLKKKERR